MTVRSRLALLVAIVLVWAAGCATEPTSVETASPTVQPAASEPTYTCGVGPAFTIDQMWTGLEAKDDEPARLLEAFTAENGWGDLDWRRVVDAEDEVLFVGGDGARMPYVMFEPTEDSWRIAASGSCTPSRIADGVHAGSWTLRPGAALDRTAHALTVLVRERRPCTDGTAPTGRVMEPEILRTDKSVTLTFFIRAPNPAPTACSSEPSNPTEVVVDLGEPLGDKALFDGAFYPTREQGRPPPGGLATCDSERGSETDLSSEPHPVTADYVHRWSKGGCLVRIDVLSMSAPGPDFHCAPWPQGMTMSTRLGQPMAPLETLSYVRSPDERWRAEGVTTTFADDITPPASARPTGYFSFDGAELLIDSATQDVVYLRYPDHTERWPQMAGVGCA